MSLQSRLAALIQAIGADVKQIKTDIIAINDALSSMSASSGSADPWSFQALSAEYTNTRTTATDVFAGFTPAPNTRYIVDILASVSAASTGTGVQTQLAGPITGITNAAVKIVSGASSTSDMITHTGLNSFQSSTGSPAGGSLLSIQAILEIGPTPGAGNIRLQAKSEVNGSTITLRAGSSMRWRVI